MILTNYINYNIDLAESITFKWHLAAVHMNLSFDSIKGLNNLYETFDLSTWKYYKNLSGEYHTIDNIILGDNGIVLTSVDSGEPIKLTKDILLTHILTQRKLRDDKVFRKQLMDKYPKHTSLIKGIINPIDIYETIEAEDGVILRYDNRLIEQQEHSLLPSIEKSIKYFLSRHVNKGFSITDNYYIPALMASITTSILFNILNTRQSKINTDEANSFFIKEHLKSNMAIDEILKVITPEVRLWVYKNLITLVDNIGTKRNLLDIIEKILKPSGIDLLELTIRQKRAIKTEDELSYFKKDNNVLFWTQVDKENSDLDNTSIDIVIEEELRNVPFTNDIIFESQEGFIRELKDKIDGVNLNDINTKVLKITPTQPVVTDSINRVTILLSNFLYLLLSTPDEESFFTDEQTGNSYKLTQRDIAILIIKSLIELTGETNKKYKTLHLFNILQLQQIDVITKDTLLKDVMNNDIIKLLETIQVFTDTGNRVDDFSNYLKSSLSTFNKIWRYKSTVSNSGAEASMDVIYNRLTNPISLSISDNLMTIDELLIEEDINFVFKKDYDYQLLIKNLFINKTGITLFKNEEVEETIIVFRSFLEKMTSYTTQILTDDLFTRDTAGYTTVDVINGINLARITEATLECLEQFTGKVKGKAIDVSDKLMVIDRQRLHYNTKVNKLNLSARVTNVEEIMIVKPRMSVTKRSLSN